MSKALWHITKSLDGFIAGPRDDMGWMVEYFGPNPTADDLLGQLLGCQRSLIRQVRRRAGAAFTP
jgi:hypothetical protein